MVAVVSTDAVHVPPHPEGERWLVVWVGPDGNAVFADSMTDVIGEIIPGYLDLDDEDEDDLALDARIVALAQASSRAQAARLAAEPDHPLSEDELNVALLPKQQAPDITAWNPALPLLLLTTHYAPYTDEPRPEGAIVWMDPSTELTFLASLQKVGFGEMWLSGFDD